ncbi:MAG: AGE family epimerase/isomerase [Sphingomonas sp.]
MREDGSVVSVVEPDGAVVRPDFDLYDYAFVLFGLAAAAPLAADRSGVTDLAIRIRENLCAGWKHPDAGFEESRPRTLPLKANPHMHIFEASLAWREAGPAAGDSGWDEIADEIAELCLAKFLHPENGSLREFFDGDWNPMAGEEGRIIEPGHQYEWAWLLIRWAALRGREDALAAAGRLIDIAETHGTDPVRGIAFNELLDDFSVRDAKARLWPQTERIKAWVALAGCAPDADAREAAIAKAAVAVRGLRKYFDYPVAGAWHEMIAPDGGFLLEDPRASSLYHITCAFRSCSASSKRERRTPRRRSPYRRALRNAGTEGQRGHLPDLRRSLGASRGVDFGKSCSPEANEHTGRAVAYRQCLSCGFAWAPDFPGLHERGFRARGLQRRLCARRSGLSGDAPAAQRGAGAFDLSEARRRDRARFRGGGGAHRAAPARARLCIWRRRPVRANRTCARSMKDGTTS